jgi:hypothetical protein
VVGDEKDNRSNLIFDIGLCGDKKGWGWGDLSA